MSESTAVAPTVRVNDQSLPWQHDECIDALLLRSGFNENNVATALNGEFLPRAQRASTTVQPGDALTVFKPIVGG